MSKVRRSRHIAAIVSMAAISCRRRRFYVKRQQLVRASSGQEKAYLVERLSAQLQVIVTELKLVWGAGNEPATFCVLSNARST